MGEANYRPVSIFFIIAIYILVQVNCIDQPGQPCGSKELKCPCKYFPDISVKINVLLCSGTNNSCDPCDRMNDAIKCRIYQYYCRQMHSSNLTPYTLIPCRCQNGGQCITNSTDCKCLKGFTGPICELKDETLATTSQVTCEPVGPSNSVIILEYDPVHPGEYIRLICNDTYTLIGNSTRYCQENGNFAGNDSQCVKTCRIPDMNDEKLDYIVNPDRNNQQQLIDRFGMPMITDIQFFCVDNFTLQGPNKIHCDDGVWDRDPPICVWTGISCQVPKISSPNMIQQPQVLSSAVAPGSILTYNCANNAKLQGDSLIVCTYSGTWDPPQPACISGMNPTPSSAINPTTSPGINPTTSPASPLPLPYCPLPMALENGDINMFVSTYNFTSELHMVSPGTSIEYECEHQYQLVGGSSTSQCLPDGSWSGNTPTCVAECGRRVSPRTPMIINGVTLDIQTWPWQVGIYDKLSEDLFCGGSLISEFWVLSAAHCFRPTRVDGTVFEIRPETIGMFFGQSISNPTLSDPNVATRNAVGIIIHPKYDPIIIDSDIALIKLHQAIKYNERIKPICLPSNTSTLVANEVGWVAGWGKRSNNKTEKISPTLQIVDIKVISQEQCKISDDGPITITENMFCGENKGKGTCQGDSGGSVCFLKGTTDEQIFQIEGIVSWGSGSLCALPGYYDGFTKVRNFVTWINELTNLQPK